MSHLTVNVLGSPQVECDGVVRAFATRKTLALLVYLAVTHEQHTRDALATLFWPESSQPQARSSLRYTLAMLKKSIGGAWLVLGQETVGLQWARPIAVDVAQFQQHLAAWRTHDHAEAFVCPRCAQALTQAVELYRADFLAGFTLPDSPAFDEWQFFQREHWQNALIGALDRLVDFHTSQAAWEPALVYARRRLALDPFHEPAHQRLMQLYTWAGRRSAALRQYEECRRFYQEEFGAAPSADTQQLYQAIKTRQLAAPMLTAIAASASPTMQPQPPLSAPPETTVKSTGVHAYSRFVARESELVQLNTFLASALAGHGRAIFISGEAGSGKTALLQAFTAQAHQRYPALYSVNGNCNAYTGSGDPFLPFREVLAKLLTPSDPPTTDTPPARRLLAGVLPAIVNEGAALINTFIPSALLTAGYVRGTDAVNDSDSNGQLRFAQKPPGRDTAVNQLRMLEQYTGVLKILAGQRPILVILDDLQWADQASIDLLFHLSRRLADQPILLVGAYRPNDVLAPRVNAHSERHPLAAVINELRRYYGEIVLDLDAANAQEGRHFIDALLNSEPNGLDAAFRTALHHHTEGQPLFTVELLRGLQASGALRQDAQGRWVAQPGLNWQRLPTRVEATIAERIGRLDEALQEVLTLAAVEGEVFTVEVIAHVQNADSRALLRCLSRELDQQQHLVRFLGVEEVNGQRLTRYRFHHFLFQNYLYSQLNASERAYLHEEVGAALEKLYGERKGEIAVHLARHFQAAGRTERATAYLLEASQRALKLAATAETIAHATNALTLLAPLPASPERTRLELALQIALGSAHSAISGYAAPAVIHAYARAAELCRQVEETPQLALVLRGLAGYYHVRAEFATARQVSEQLLTLAQRLADPALLLAAHLVLGANAHFRGEFAPAHAHLAQAWAKYNRQQHATQSLLFAHDGGVTCLTHLAWVLWPLGHPDQALAHSQAALALAQELNHAPTIAHALHFVAVMHFYRREWQLLQTQAEANITFATQQHLPFWLAEGMIMRGYALVEQGVTQEGHAFLQEGSAAHQATGAGFLLPTCCALLAQAYAATGDIQEGLRRLAEGLALVEQTGERWWEVELHRRQGELLLLAGEKPAVAEACFRRAIALARQQQAKSWELRATLSLCRLWQRQGRGTEALALLTAIHGWFTEGFATPDLQEAAGVLTKLS